MMRCCLLLHTVPVQCCAFIEMIVFVFYLRHRCRDDRSVRPEVSWAPGSGGLDRRGPALGDDAIVGLSQAEMN